MFDLAPGDVLSYSASSTQTGPEGFRKLRARPGLLQAALKRWPDLAASFGERTPMFIINAYPAAIGMIIAGVSMLGYILAREQAPQAIAELFLSMTDSPLGFLIAVNVMIFVLGMFIESLAILLIVVPMLVPIAMGYHIDPVHFGVVVVFNLMISTLTPPMGIALFVVAKVGNIPFQLLARAIIPWLIPPVIVLVLLTAFPPLVTWLPNLMK